MREGRVDAPPKGRAEPDGSPPVEVTAGCLELVRFEPLRARVTEALAGGERVGLIVGRLEDGGRVETVLFAPSGRAAQSTGTWVYAGLWSGDRVLTLNGHALDRDGCCFCRACDQANGFEGQDED